MNKPLIIVQMVNYNGLLLEDNIFEKSILSVLNQTYKNFIFHIIDNNSNDNSVEFIKQTNPGIKITKLKKNTGYVANNKGLDYFKFSEARYLIIMNNDIILESNTIEKMVNFMENNKDIGASSPIMKFYQKRDFINSSGLITNYAAFTKNSNFMKCESIYIEENISALSGGFMIIRKNVIDKIGLFDNIYSSYYEDVDFSLRILSETNFTIKINKDCEVYHLYSGSWKNKKNKKDYFMLRNQYILVLKLFPIDLLFLSVLFFIKTRFLKRNLIHFKILLFFIFNILFILIKRLIHLIKSKRNIKEFLYASFVPFENEIKFSEQSNIVVYENINKDKISDNIIMGVNDNILGKGFSLLSKEYPIGRYICKEAELFLLNSNKKYVKIHGYGNGEIEINDEKYNVENFFSVYINNNFKDDIIKLIFKSNENIKIIKVNLCDEKI